MNSEKEVKRFSDNNNNNNNKDTYIHTYHTYDTYTEFLNKTEDIKILKSYKIHYHLSDSFKLFCDFLHVNASEGVEWAMMDFMRNHAGEVPAQVMFNLVPMPTPKAPAVSCEYRGCKNEAVAQGKWRGKSVKLCTEHLAEAKQNKRDWSDLSKVPDIGLALENQKVKP